MSNPAQGVDLATLELAQAILAAQKLSEESFDSSKSEQMLLANPNADIRICQGISLYDACYQVGGKWAQPAYLLLTGTWNDATDWAKGVVLAADTAKAIADIEAITKGSAQ